MLLTGALGLTWALFALALLAASFSERQSLFQQLVNSQQDVIASGQFRPFIEGIERLSNGRFKGTRVCWFGDPCKLPEPPSTQFLWVRTNAPVFGGDTQIATVWTYVSIRQPIGEALAGLLLVFASAAVFFYGLAALRRQFLDAQRALAAWTKDLVSGSGSSQPSGMPIELAPLASAFEKAVVQLKKTESEKAGAIASFRVATQVAHDIRSPLAALNAAEGDLRSLPEDARLLVKGAVSRIADIANHLLEVNRLGGNDSGSISISAREAQFVACLVEEMAAEKRAEFRGKSQIEIRTELDLQSFGLFVSVEAREFKRILSNLINNAIDALDNSGLVIIRSLCAPEGKIEIRIEDDGKGIPDAILSKLGDRGISFGKEGGSGLGLYHAHSNLEKWGGSLQLRSKLGIGTIATISLPLVAPPPWSIDSIAVRSNSNLVVIDDDANIHGTWRGRAAASGFAKRSIRLTNLFSPKDLRIWKSSKASERETCVYLCDYEFLGFAENGLDIIEELGIADNSILVTSHHGDPFVRARCLSLGMPIIPKGIAGLMPIRIL